MQLDHINIKAPQATLEVIKDFYCNIFEMAIGPRPNINHSGYWLYKDDNALIHLSESENLLPIETRNNLDHVAFRMSGLTQFVERLECADVPYSIKFNTDTNTSQIFFHDPAGVRLEANFKAESLVQFEPI